MVIDGFTFNDFCLSCKKLMEHKVALEKNEFFGICSSCERRRLMTDLNEVYYTKTDLWVTRFKIGNIPSVVTGKLLKSAKHPHSPSR